jgi:hypothetical protein
MPEPAAAARPKAPAARRSLAGVEPPPPPARDADLLVDAVKDVSPATWKRVARYAVVGLLLLNAALTGFTMFSTVLLVLGVLASVGAWLLSREHE